jgi:hypothetical protein
LRPISYFEWADSVLAVGVEQKANDAAEAPGTTVNEIL